MVPGTVGGDGGASRQEDKKGVPGRIDTVYTTGPLEAKAHTVELGD